MLCNTRPTHASATARQPAAAVLGLPVCSSPPGRAGPPRQGWGLTCPSYSVLSTWLVLHTDVRVAPWSPPPVMPSPLEFLTSGIRQMGTGWITCVAPILSLTIAGSKEVVCHDCHSCEKTASARSLRGPSEETPGRAWESLSEDRAHLGPHS